ncbi:hypothetical protein [Pseudochryseolinea flava]|uniref:Transporter n=1 Tax=Pseudochryseolinea flava TaxID=2059302 RepID=A0A364Y042_9BACT|nr:hypothetical protein [Pseudochryseolinea flava]RAW00029.1 hypothetical protein DQQ10_15850 [Pseudochryseolinea flava]
MNLRVAVMLLFMRMPLMAFAQQDTSIQKGSYLYYGQPLIEDNAMLMEEAFNQETGKHQFIFNYFRSGDATAYTFTHEIPLGNHLHQISYSIPFGVLQHEDYSTSGWDDILITYRPMIADKYDWALFIPGVSIVVPTGNTTRGIGNGGWGILASIAMTKRFSQTITTHYNMNGSWVPRAMLYMSSQNGDAAGVRHQYRSGMLGASVVWHCRPQLNLMMENQCFFSARVKAEGTFERNVQYILNPGVRFALHHKKTQFVPAIGIPISFVDGALEQVGVFLYLSVETSRY